MRDTSFQMQHRSYVTQNVSSATQTLKTKASSTAKAPLQDDLVRVFNTALLSSQAKAKRAFSAEIRNLTESLAFKAILNAVRQLARVQGITDRQAAEQIIQTFRKMDEIWGEYVFHEGLDGLRKPKK